MGQISLPVINRSGITSHWLSSGDSKYGTSTLYTKDFYVRSVLNTLLTQNINLKKYTLSTIEDRWSFSLSSKDRLLDTPYLLSSTSEFKLFTPRVELPNNLDSYYSLIDLDSSGSLNNHLPTYLSKLLILKKGDTLLLVNRYFDIVKGTWESRLDALSELGANRAKRSTKVPLRRKPVSKVDDVFTENLLF